ncbi:MAG: hypothetical protein EBY80_01070 [Actinobacteria bacterium]|nr:hypothetical protein [Actinomycetota bacterium]
MSSPDRSGELLAIAERVVAMARPGEQLEAYVSRGLSTDVRVYEGEVEHFVSAQSEGIGIRVIPTIPTHSVKRRWPPPRAFVWPDARTAVT